MDEFVVNADYKFQQLDITPEEFYGDKQSIYIRCTYKPDIRGFKVMIFNQIDVKDVNQDLMFMATLCRGLAAAALQYPADMYELGRQAQENDREELKETLSPEQKDLFDAEPGGSA
jgi:hypothetical protein